MRRALSILAVVAMTVGLFATTTENEIQDQEVITCDDCALDFDDTPALATDKYDRESDDREV